MLPNEQFMIIKHIIREVGWSCLVVAVVYDLPVVVGPGLTDIGHPSCKCNHAICDFHILQTKENNSKQMLHAVWYLFLL